MMAKWFIMLSRNVIPALRSSFRLAQRRFRVKPRHPNAIDICRRLPSMAASIASAARDMVDAVSSKRQCTDTGHHRTASSGSDSAQPTDRGEDPLQRSEPHDQPRYAGLCSDQISRAARGRTLGWAFMQTPSFPGAPSGDPFDALRRPGSARPGAPTSKVALRCG
jgi:hypothetical protein